MCALSLAGYQVSDGPSSALDEIDRKWIAGHFQLMWSGAGPVVLLSRTGLIVAAYQQARWFGAEPEQRACWYAATIKPVRERSTTGPAPDHMSWKWPAIHLRSISSSAEDGPSDTW